MITPLPEPEVWFDQETNQWCWLAKPSRPTFVGYHTAKQLRQYGEAEYKRGIESAAQVCTGIALRPSNCILGVAVECAQAIRKLGVSK